MPYRNVQQQKKRSIKYNQEKKIKRTQPSHVNAVLCYVVSTVHISVIGIPTFVAQFQIGATPYTRQCPRVDPGKGQ